MTIKRVLITGGTGGLGEAFIKKYSINGYEVFFTYSSDKEKALLLEQRYPNSKAFHLTFDSESFDADLNVLENAMKNVDILINNAGINNDGIFLMQDFEIWEKTFKVNFLFSVKLTKRILPLIINKERTGNIIFISSVAGNKASRGQTSYSSSKAAIQGFSLSLALELSSIGIRVNTVSPGYIETDMLKSMPDNKIVGVKKEIPLKRFGKPEEVADLVYFISSNDSSYLTGQNITLDGGLTM